MKRMLLVLFLSLWMGAVLGEGSAPSTDEPMISEHTVVTANRTEQDIEDIPANVTVLTEEDVKKTAALVSDDVVRRIPDSPSTGSRTASGLPSPRGRATCAIWEAANRGRW